MFSQPNCKLCPCPDICLGWPSFCNVASKNPPIQIELNHICNRSKMGNSVLVRSNNDTENRISIQKTAISTGNGNLATIPTSESIQLIKEMKSCPHYEKNGCNTCGKAFCKINKGEPGSRVGSEYGLVSTWDCFACLRPGVELYEQNKYKQPL